MPNPRPTSPDAARILGLDPGLQTTGYAVLEVAAAGPKVCDAGVIRSADKREPCGHGTTHPGPLRWTL